jgi:mono/diheme cytochrome c family protein
VIVIAKEDSMIHGKIGASRRMMGVGVMFMALVGCQGTGTTDEQSAKQDEPGQSQTAAQEDPVKRGEYLVTIGGCNDCHTPLQMGPNGPAPDMTRMLSGHPETLPLTMPDMMTDPNWMLLGSSTATAYAGPWGLTFAINLTPDETGLGVWTEKMFIDALRTGKHMGVGRPIFPPMPWQAYARMTDEDLKAIFAYLQSVPPIKNQAPQYIAAPGAAAPPQH